MTIAIALLVILTVLGVLLLVTLFGGARPPEPRLRAGPEGALHRYECTCGWSAWRTYVIAPEAFKCPRCNGVAVRRSPLRRESP
jgi:predicted RNA-binding Zn-ribbon protein involved in translation (DUF1610 family)